MGVYISAAHKSSGKTTVTLGLCAAYAARGLKVSPFKKGPDYIDPMWLTKAATTPCYNLDFYTMARDEITSLYRQKSHFSDLTIVEGNKGLYDGLSIDGSDSNGAMVKLLELPVLLVINCNGITRGVAPLLLGYQAFDPEIKIAGVILNQTGGSRHESKLQQVVEEYTDITILGSIGRVPEMEIVERHLGLLPSNEADQAQHKIEEIKGVVESSVNLDQLLEISKIEKRVELEKIETIDSIHNLRDIPKTATPNLKSKIRVGIAKDEAFGFYYESDLDEFRSAGVELVPFSPIHDQKLPTVDALFIGGGFPETQSSALEQNSKMRAEIYAAIESGMPVYAECGGLMYLSRQIEWNGKVHKMVGTIAGDCKMHKRPQGRGYVKFIHNQKTTPAHEFHYSSLDNLADDVEFTYRIKRGFGVDGKRDGIIYKNLLASYIHQRNSRDNSWVKQFIDKINILTN